MCFAAVFCSYLGYLVASFGIVEHTFVVGELVTGK